jgi:hypothetical protein
MANPLKQFFSLFRKIIDTVLGKRIVIKKVEIIKEVPVHIIKEIIKEVEVPVEKKIYIARKPTRKWKKKSDKRGDDCDNKKDEKDKD